MFQQFEVILQYNNWPPLLLLFQFITILLYCLQLLIPISQRLLMDSPHQETQLKKKYIIFRNPHTNEIIAEVQIPKYIKLNQSQVCNLQDLRNRLKMLYIDVLCRGFHPVKGFQSSARNVFKHQEIQDNEESLTKNVNLIPIVSSDAVGTIWRCLARQIGRPIKNYNMKQVQHQIMCNLKKLRADSSISEFQLKNNYDNSEKNLYYASQKQLGQLQNKIKKQLQNIINKCNEQQKKHKQTQNHIVQVISHQIIQLQHNVFIKSLVCIKQCGQNTQIIVFIMQQCYPFIKMSKKQAIRILGQQLFNQKLQRYTQIVQKYAIQSQDIIVCHRCLRVLNPFSRQAACNDSNAVPKVGNTLLSDPYVYSKQIINQNITEKQSRSYIHPYLNYYFLNDNKKTPVCNRYFCNKCQGEEPSLQNTTGICGYCQGTCNCYRCQSMDLLTKMMAIFIDNGGDLKVLSTQFFMNFPTKILNLTNKKTLRSQRNNQQFKEHLQFFKGQHIIIKKNQIQNFQKILFFSERIEEDQKQKYSKYKMRKQKISQSESQRLQRQQKQFEEKQKVKKLNQIIEGKAIKSLRKQKGNQKESQKQQTINRKVQKLETITKKASKNLTEIQKSNSDQRYDIYSQSDDS